MRMSKMVGRRLREVPKDAKTVSHQFLIRGGYIRPVSTGIYSLLPVGERIVIIGGPATHSTENTLRTVVFTCAPAEQKLAKSCSPSRYAAALFIRSTSSG